MKLKDAKKVLEVEVAILIDMPDFILNKDRDHSEILVVKLGGDLNEVARRVASKIKEGNC